MDAQIKEIITWMLGLMATSALTLGLGIFNIVKAGKMMPRELKEKDIDNKSKEVDLAEHYEKIAASSAERVLKTQETNQNLQNQIDELKQQVKDLLENQNSQNKVIEEQAVKLEAAEQEIAKLVCELDKYKRYNAALIKQMQEAQIIPVEMDIPVVKPKSYGSKTKGT